MMIKKYTTIFFLTDKIRFVIITRNYDKSGTVEYNIEWGIWYNHQCGFSSFYICILLFSEKCYSRVIYKSDISKKYK